MKAVIDLSSDGFNAKVFRPWSTGEGAAEYMLELWWNGGSLRLEGLSEGDLKVLYSGIESVLGGAVHEQR